MAVVIFIKRVDGSARRPLAFCKVSGEFALERG